MLTCAKVKREADDPGKMNHGIVAERCVCVAAVRGVKVGGAANKEENVRSNGNSVRPVRLQSLELLGVPYRSAVKQDT